MHPAEGKRTDEWIEHCQRALITLETAFVLILGEELGGSFAKRVFALFTEEMYASGLGHASCEQRLGLDAITCAAALAEPLAVDDLIDMPDTTPKEQARRSSRSWGHGGLKSRRSGFDNRMFGGVTEQAFSLRRPRNVWVLPHGQPRFYLSRSRNP